MYMCFLQEGFCGCAVGHVVGSWHHAIKEHHMKDASYSGQIVSPSNRRLLTRRGGGGSESPRLWRCTNSEWIQWGWDWGSGWERRVSMAHALGPYSTERSEFLITCPTVLSALNHDQHRRGREASRSVTKPNFLHPCHTSLTHKYRETARPKIHPPISKVKPNMSEASVWSNNNALRPPLRGGSPRIHG